MNKIAELWSVPWHELQRNLAADAMCANGCHQSVAAGASVRVSARAGVALPSGSWLVRARNRTLSPPVSTRASTAK